MNPYLNKKEIKERCKNPNFCIACFRIRDKVKVDEHRVCKDCRRGSKKGPIRLPVITLKNGKSYFVDNRLRELRHIHNPHDWIDFRDLLDPWNDLLPW